MTDTLRDERERGWFHIDNAVVDEYLPRIGVTAFAVYACIVRHADRAGNAFPSYTLLQKELGCGRSQVAAAIKKIVEAGLVTITTGARASNQYHVVTVSTSPKPELVPNRNQSRSETATSPGARPELVPIRDSNKTQLTRPNEQDPRGREGVRANGHMQPQARAPAPRLIPIPEPFVIPDQFWEWADEKKYKTAWVKERIEAYVLQYSGSSVRRSQEEWLAKCQRWILEDASKTSPGPPSGRR